MRAVLVLKECDMKTVFDAESTFVKCPECSTVSLLDDCDVGLADEGCVFCNHHWTSDGREFWCTHEFSVEKNLFEFPEAPAAEPLEGQMELFA